MELFLLMSIAMSIVMFISIALTQSPPSSSFSQHSQVEVALQPNVDAFFPEDAMHLEQGDSRMSVEFDLPDSETIVSDRVATFDSETVELEAVLA